MEFELYDRGKELLRNADNIDWIEKITCWIKKEAGYNIYVFQVIVENQKEIEEYYETITAAIAVDFQAGLEKAIERWNIYLVFECKETIDWEIRLKVEQNKYAVRKVIWDNLKEEEMKSKDYLKNRLLCLHIKDKAEKPKEKENLINIIREQDCELYNILQKKNMTIEEKAVVYIGDGINE